MGLGEDMPSDLHVVLVPQVRKASVSLFDEAAEHLARRRRCAGTPGIGAHPSPPRIRR